MDTVTRPQPWEQRLRPYAAGALLALALLFVAAVTYLPHMVTSEDDRDQPAWSRLGGAYWGLLTGEREDYPYPLHVDENVHWVRMSAIQRHDTVHYPNPYVGGSRENHEFGLGAVHEGGFSLAFAQFQEMTGIPFIQLIRFAPTAFAALTASLVWVALRPWPGAPLAAAFVALVPTSARFLGPSFLVPSGIGLVWIAAALALTQWITRDHGVLALTVLLGAWAFFIHLIDGAAIVLLLAIALPLALHENRRHLLVTIAAILLPLVWFYQRLGPAFRSEAEKFSTIPADYTIFDQIGVPMLIAWGIGGAIMVLRPPRGAARVPVLTATIASFVVFGAMVLNRRLDWNLYALYDRWHQPLAVLIAIPAAYLVVEALRWAFEFILARSTTENWQSRRVLSRPFAVGCIALIIAAPAGAALASAGLDAHLREEYYHVLEDDDWTRFVAAANIGPHHEIFLTHPWKAPVYLAMTGKYPYTWLDPGAPPARGSEYAEYHMGKHADPIWLVERDISIVLEPLGAAEPFKEVAPGVYALDHTLADRIHALRTS